MERDEDKKPVTPADFKRSGGDTGESNGKDPATTNNEPFDEGQLETEHPEPATGEHTRTTGNDETEHVET